MAQADDQLGLEPLQHNWRNCRWLGYGIAQTKLQGLCGSVSSGGGNRMRNQAVQLPSKKEGPKAGINDQQDSRQSSAQEGPAPVHRHWVVVAGAYRGRAALLVALHVLRRHRRRRQVDEAPDTDQRPGCPGRLSGSNVEQNPICPAGTLIAEIDPKDFEVAVQQDEPAWKAPRANYEAVRVERRRHRNINTSSSTLQSATIRREDF